MVGMILFFILLSFFFVFFFEFYFIYVFVFDYQGRCKVCVGFCQFVGEFGEFYYFVFEKVLVFVSGCSFLEDFLFVEVYVEIQNFEFFMFLVVFYFF